MLVHFVRHTVLCYIVKTGPRWVEQDLAALGLPLPLAVSLQTLSSLLHDRHGNAGFYSQDLCAWVVLTPSNKSAKPHPARLCGTTEQGSSNLGSEDSMQAPQMVPYVAFWRPADPLHGFFRGEWELCLSSAYARSNRSR